MITNLNADEWYMARALQLAEIGRGQVAPNPMVGCVIVHEGKIIGEGWHQKYGEAHAEVNAVNSVADKSILSQSTVYVSLEPCAHFGKTPPCADLLVSLHPKKVVVCNLDPNPMVAGKGLEKLQSAGIEVVTDVLKEAGWELNRRFFTFMTQKRPYIILKWAETADGFIARANYDSKWISNSLARQRVHQWRTEESAIMVGTNTAQYDNPQLTARDWTGNQPLRVVIDRHLRLADTLHLFDQSTPTLCYNQILDRQEPNLSWVKLSETDFIPLLFPDLYERKVQSIIVEGGSFLLNSLLQKNLWDEIRLFKSPQCFGTGITAPPIRGKLIKTQKILTDNYFEYRNE
ncbi:MAG: bifunctional diaminohydroxyphosphoribosylaminopyrimidine deaminase/5-amino-6-(5-phosphoribosylamino)uracil reductase RibD [Microscillaceae bacterium]|jgi:diaminohydroxyphosphoribosylaminopyrimidine deaminase/5-amino-6-(5-phosphoribosylamino)uracil reductase|nr:bifunctional diaminohydroxyphosphoribosylaminopyrimidine deaminase/5-amino-6-(5-phosphoribosylamino)uracil reductase RibD [Microscillaceae bacterium]